MDMPEGRPPSNDWLLEELLWCLRCSRQMQPAPHVDGMRYYSCGPDCEQPDVPATRLEQDLLFKAMVRAYAAVYRFGREAELPEEGTAIVDVGVELAFKGATPWRLDGQLAVSKEELRCWQQCDISDRRSILLAAFVRVIVDADGVVHPVWRHAVAAQASAATAQ